MCLRSSVANWDFPHVVQKIVRIENVHTCFSREVKYLLIAETRHRLRKRCHKKKLQVLNSGVKITSDWFLNENVHIHLDKQKTLKNTQLNSHSKKGRAHYNSNDIVVKSACIFERNKMQADIGREKTLSKIHNKFRPGERESSLQPKRLGCKIPTHF